MPSWHTCKINLSFLRAYNTHPLKARPCFFFWFYLRLLLSVPLHMVPGTHVPCQGGKVASLGRKEIRRNRVIQLRCLFDKHFCIHLPFDSQKKLFFIHSLASSLLLPALQSFITPSSPTSWFWTNCTRYFFFSPPFGNRLFVLFS